MTGATGAVGRRLPVLAPEWEFFAVGRSELPERSNVHFVEADLRDVESLVSALHGPKVPRACDAVVHLAVARRRELSYDGALASTLEISCRATAKLLEYAYRASARSFVFGSTGSVYGSKRAVHREDDLPQPENDHALARCIGEELALGAASSTMPAFVPRFYLPFGAGQADRLVADLIRRVANREPVHVPRDGSALTSAPLYADDAAHVVINGVERRLRGVMNVAGPEVLTLAQMAQVIGEVVKQAPSFEADDSATSATLVPDLSKLHAAFAEHRFRSFREGIELTTKAEAV